MRKDDLLKKMEEFSEKQIIDNAEETDDTAGWEKEMEEKRKKHLQEEELNKLVKKLEKEREEGENKFVKKKYKK